jgi:hypothetical protein
MDFNVRIDLSPKSAPAEPAPRPSIPDPVRVDHPLWPPIRDLAIGSPQASLSFTDRLARDHLWSTSYAERVVREYRRFLFLIATSDERLTPSEDVDEAWHLHLSYSRSYWDDLCGGILGRPLHHEPTAGIEEQQGFERAYERTRARYAEVFDEPPTLAIWPKSAERFSVEDGFRTIPYRDFWILRRQWPGRGRFLRHVVPFALTGTAIWASVAASAWGFWAVVGAFALIALFGNLLRKLTDPRAPPMVRSGRDVLAPDRYQTPSARVTGGGAGCGGCGGCG